MANSLYQWLVVGIMAVLHPLYVSVIEINHNAKEKSVETSVRIFSDDLEAVLKKFGNTKVDLAHPSDKVALDRLVNSFMQQKLSVKVDGKPIVLNYLGYEQKQESAWIYFETPNIASLKRVDVNCSLLYDFKESQMNIFHVKANGSEQSYKLDNPKKEASFQF